VKPDHTLIEIKLTVESISLYLNNIKINLTIGLITMRNLDTTILIKDGGTETEGSLGNLEINDLTNWPKTVFLTGITTEIFSARKNPNGMLNFKILNYYEGNPKKRDNINNEIEINMNSVNFCYYNQPFRRIVDYLLYKVLGV
jgi:hypothetical protein